jgi:hypothetical protein
MALSPPMNGAYFNGLDTTGGRQTALANIPGSVTTDYFLFSLNVAGVDINGKPSADINYGWDYPGNPNNPTGIILASGGIATNFTKQTLGGVVQAGFNNGYLKRVWLTIGAAPDGTNNTNTFTNMQTLLGGPLKSALLANLYAIAEVFITNTGVGFDMDYEENGDLASAVSVVTNSLVDYFLGVKGWGTLPITFCPSLNVQSEWISALQKIYSHTKTWQPVVGYNLQTYAGGTPADWWQTIANAQNTGVDPNNPNFVWPIVSCDPTTTVTPPNQVAQQLENWNSPSMGYTTEGASLWGTEFLSPTGPYTLHGQDGYSAAIAQGIQ